MIRTLLISIILLSVGCSMNGNNLSSYILGDWKSAPIDTEWGTMVMHVSFKSNNTFKIENYFDANKEPTIIYGKFRLEDSNLYCDSWNKGKPIAVTKKNTQLVLMIDEDNSMILNRVN
jgi:hypothetical protein